MKKQSILLIFFILICVYFFMNKNDLVPENIKQKINDIFPENIKQKMNGSSKIKYDKFPIPQISTMYKSLSHIIPENPLYNNKTQQIDDSLINIIRSSNVDNDKNPIYYKPTYYKKDFVSSNPLGTTEYNFAEFNDKETSYAWTDNNVSQHPAFYRSKFTDEKTNVGKFFDTNNRFHDKTSPYSTNNLPDRCFLNKDNEIICNFNDKLQNIPPSIITDDKLLNKIGVIGKINGLYEDIVDNKVQTFNFISRDNEEKEMNGGNVYDDVLPSTSNNETYLDLNSEHFVKNYAI